jgi:hypothetical protein
MPQPNQPSNPFEKVQPITSGLDLSSIFQTTEENNNQSKTKEEQSSLEVKLERLDGEIFKISQTESDYAPSDSLSVSELMEALEKYICIVTFRKISNGATRVMTCTRNTTLGNAGTSGKARFFGKLKVPRVNSRLRSSVINTPYPKSGLITVFDMDIRFYRSFYYRTIESVDIKVEKTKAQEKKNERILNIVDLLNRAKEEGKPFGAIQEQQPLETKTSEQPIEILSAGLKVKKNRIKITEAREAPQNVIPIVTKEDSENT